MKPGLVQLLNALGIQHAQVRDLLGDEVADQCMCAVVDALTEDGRAFVNRLALALFATEVSEEIGRVLTGTVRPQTSAALSLEDAIRWAANMPPALPQPSVYYVDLIEPDPGP